MGVYQFWWVIERFGEKGCNTAAAAFFWGYFDDFRSLGFEFGDLRVGFYGVSAAEILVARRKHGGGLVFFKFQVCSRWISCDLMPFWFDLDDLLLFFSISGTFGWWQNDFPATELVCVLNPSRLGGGESTRLPCDLS